MTSFSDSFDNCVSTFGVLGISVTLPPPEASPSWFLSATFGTSIRLRDFRLFSTDADLRATCTISVWTNNISNNTNNIEHQSGHNIQWKLFSETNIRIYIKLLLLLLVSFFFAILITEKKVWKCMDGERGSGKKNKS